MPTLAEATGQDMSNYTPVTASVVPPSGTAPPSDQQPGLSSFTRCPLPPIWQASPDSLRSYYQAGKVPQYRLLNPPIVNASSTVNTTVVTSVSNSNSVTSGGGVSSPTIVDAEIPAGLINGTNTIFTLSHSPSPSTGLNLYVNGLYQIQGVGGDYTLAGNTITMAIAPGAGYLIRASYRY